MQLHISSFWAKQNKNQKYTVASACFNHRKLGFYANNKISVDNGYAEGFWLLVKQVQYIQWDDLKTKDGSYEYFFALKASSLKALLSIVE